MYPTLTDFSVLIFAFIRKNTVPGSKAGFLLLCLKAEPIFSFGL